MNNKRGKEVKALYSQRSTADSAAERQVCREAVACTRPAATVGALW